MPRKAGRRKHIPQRTCVSCREVLPKRTMIRIVRTPGGVVIDPTGKLDGRGAYLHDQRSCWEQGLKGALDRALKTHLTPEERKNLLAFMETLTEKQADEHAQSADRINQDIV